MKTKNTTFLTSTVILASVILSGCAGNPPQTNQSQNQTQNNNSIPNNTCAAQCPPGLEQAAFPDCSCAEPLKTENLTPQYVAEHFAELANKTISVVGMAEISDKIPCTASICSAGNPCCNGCGGSEVMLLREENYSIDLVGPSCVGNECKLSCDTLVPGRNYVVTGNWTCGSFCEGKYLSEFNLRLSSYQEIHNVTVFADKLQYWEDEINFTVKNGLDKKITYYDGSACDAPPILVYKDDVLVGRPLLVCAVVPLAVELEPGENATIQWRKNYDNNEGQRIRKALPGGYKVGFAFTVDGASQVALSNRFRIVEQNITDDGFVIWNRG